MYWIIFIAAFTLFGCQSRQEQNKLMPPVSVKTDSMQQLKKDSVVQGALKEKENNRLDSLADIAKSKPIWGERMTIVGDFDGDGTQDTLYEKYISQVTGKETNKDYDFEGELGENCCDWLFYKQKWIFDKHPLVQVVSRKNTIKPFNVESNGCQNGFGYLKNVGDLNGDSTDEIVYYIYDVDMSSMNSCALATYKSGKWEEVHHWSIYEGDFQYEEGHSKPNPVYVKKKDGKFYCKEMDDDWGGYRWKKIKTNW